MPGSMSKKRTGSPARTAGAAERRAMRNPTYDLQCRACRRVGRRDDGVAAARGQRSVARKVVAPARDPGPGLGGVLPGRFRTHARRGRLAIVVLVRSGRRPAGAGRPGPGPGRPFPGPRGAGPVVGGPGDEPPRPGGAWLRPSPSSLAL